jgi:hypothetical protein
MLSLYLTTTTEWPLVTRLLGLPQYGKPSPAGTIVNVPVGELPSIFIGSIQPPVLSPPAASVASLCSSFDSLRAFNEAWRGAVLIALSEVGGSEVAAAISAIAGAGITAFFGG